MTHNEHKYPDPMRFMPERYIDANGRLTDDIAEQQFGFGRRICVGKYLAEASVWIAMVSVLAVFNVNKARDGRGREVDVVPEYTPGVIIHPKPYPFCITPRSPHATQLIQQTEVDH
jgi:cytochrome P450